ncbi:hypothetical protein B296_00057476 [Ensete ventricosum]|uniref:Uncharacterized protein n=1 Tax=Ensete ventricosum TaxID=4639 RepID=A0A426XFM9_ENSVE|nr:hypothetical protein B296_00057476 [Ensete ventricosum]
MFFHPPLRFCEQIISRKKVIHFPVVARIAAKGVNIFLYTHNNIKWIQKIKS